MRKQEEKSWEQVWPDYAEDANLKPSNAISGQAMPGASAEVLSRSFFTSIASLSKLGSSIGVVSETQQAL